MRALRDYAEKNNYLVVREYVDEAESGRVADRPQFGQMLDAATAPDPPFEEILVWKFSRFTRKREDAVAFKSMLRRRGVRVVSITEHADDSPTGKLMEAIIESVDEFYSANLAEEVTRGMREAVEVRVGVREEGREVALVKRTGGVVALALDGGQAAVEALGHDVDADVAAAPRRPVVPKPHTGVALPEHPVCLEDLLDERLELPPALPWVG